MGSVKKKTITRKLPEGAEVLTRRNQQYAEWIGRNGRKRTASVKKNRSGVFRIQEHTKVYYAKYRDGQGVLREVSTGCRDKQAATVVLHNLEGQVEKVKSGIISPDEDRIAKHQATPIAEHVKTYLTRLEAHETSTGHRDNVRRSMTRIIDHCRFATLPDFNREAFERYLAYRKNEDSSARTRNLDRASLVAFCNWCIETNRLTANPFEGVKKANEDTDRRLERRSLTVEEINRLLAATRERPLREALTIRTGKNKGKRIAKVRPEVREKLTLLGRERALIYSTLLYTGLRKSELASLTLAQVILEEEIAYLIVRAGDEKAKRGAKMPLYPELANAIRSWIRDREQRHDGPLPRKARLFTVPRGLDRIFNRDLELAEIEKHDALGRVADVHCLRHTHASLLAKLGVSPAVAQKSMRHSDVRLTMGVYTHLEMEDVRQAVSLLPQVAIEGINGERRPQRRNYEEANGHSSVAPDVAPKTDKRRALETIPDNRSKNGAPRRRDMPIDVKSCPGKRKRPLTTPVNGLFEERETGFEPATSSLGKLHEPAEGWQLSS